jgi:hypothetical protein
MAEGTVKLDFINRDVTAQLDTSKRLIEIANDLKGILDKVSDTDARYKLTESITGLFRLAGELAANANNTSNAAITVISSVRPGF